MSGAGTYPPSEGVDVLSKNCPENLEGLTNILFSNLKGMEMAEAPHVPAAFINAIAEEGTKEEAIAWLQKVWNENCQLRRARLSSDYEHGKLYVYDATTQTFDPFPETMV